MLTDMQWHECACALPHRCPEEKKTALVTATDVHGRTFISSSSSLFHPHAQNQRALTSFRPFRKRPIIHLFSRALWIHATFYSFLYPSLRVLTHIRIPAHSRACMHN